MPDLISHLKTNISFLSSVESRIARIIIDDPARFIGYTLLDLASEADVSQGSIINFSKKFVKGGFPELKLTVAANMKHLSPPKSTESESETKLSNVLAHTAHTNAAAHLLTVTANPDDTVKLASERILNAKKVEIYGIYRSAAVATDFWYQLLELGIPTTFVGDILTCAVSASMLNEDSLVVAISASGQTKDVLDAVKKAKEKNVPVIAITSNAASPIAMLSDTVLVASASSDPEGASTSEIRSSQLLITDAICACIRGEIGNSNRERYLEFERILSSHSIKKGDF